MDSETNAHIHPRAQYSLWQEPYLGDFAKVWSLGGVLVPAGLHDLPQFRGAILGHLRARTLFRHRLHELVVVPSSRTTHRGEYMREIG
jgi:hypothetical protein